MPTTIQIQPENSPTLPYLFVLSTMPYVETNSIDNSIFIFLHMVNNATVKYVNDLCRLQWQVGKRKNTYKRDVQAKKRTRTMPMLEK